MRVLVVTPLYPPDIAPLAVYVKEFARRFSLHADITILAYAHIPEKIDGVRIVTVTKNIPLFFRLFSFTYTLWKESRTADMLFVQNGASVELPASLVSLFCHIPQVVRLGDYVALASAQKRWGLKIILDVMLSRATHIVEEQATTITSKYSSKTTSLETPPLRPEILPFAEYPKEALEQYERSWNEYLRLLTDIFIHAKK